MLSSFCRVSPSGGTPLKIGLLVDSPEVPKLFLEILKHIANAEFAQLDFVVRLKRPGRSDRGGLLFRVYDRWDQARSAGINDPFESTGFSGALAEIPSLDAAVNDGDISSAAIDVVGGRKLDVLLSFTSGPVPRGLLQVARYGVWAYEFGDGERYAGSPPYFWEVRDGHPLSCSRLYVLSEDQSVRRLLSQAQFATLPVANTSWRNNRVRPGWASTDFVIQKLSELHSRGALESTETQVALPFNEKRRSSPSNGEMIRWLLPKMAGKAIRRLRRSSRSEHWQMAIRVGSRRLWTGDQRPNTDGFQWVRSEPGHLYADPFLIRHQGRTWLFYEHYRYSEQRAVIDCGEVLADGQLVDSGQALQRNHHLSFPHVFEHAGEVFMIPETGGNRTVELYRATRFPYEWKLEKVLLAGHWIVDTAVWHDGQFWWFFTTMKEPRGEGTALVLFYSDELTGEWRYHPRNPICTDVRKIRGAGAIFRQANRLLRPSQDGSVRYGYRLNFHAITTLNPEEYREERVFTLDPAEWAGLVGVHTYNQSSGVEVIDGCVLATQEETGGYASAVIAPKDAAENEPALATT